MSDNRDNFSPCVRAKLACRAGWRCSMPSCRALTVGPSDEGPGALTNIGVAAHITGAALRGPRFDPALTPKERSSVSNGIWMCQTHGKEVDDDQSRFTTDVLRTWKRLAEEDARRLLGKAISAQSLDISVKVRLHRASDNSLIVTGSTSLPDGTKLLVGIYRSGTCRTLGKAQTVVNEGMLAAGGFRNGEMPHPHGWYTVELSASFNDAWRQPEAVLSVAGRNGEYLAGEFAKPRHPELAESEKSFCASFECVAPLFVGVPDRTSADRQRAIEITQHAVLVVDGRKSASPIVAVVEYFLSSPGVRPREGWSAQGLSNGAVVVAFSLWDGDRPAVAEWIVILETREVRYQNRYAKQMSWLSEE